ncbi:MFS transporter [Olivibacter sp. SDN3]|uniref:MFS transporter n=1 Tax=Olivibacter sp. SDN3 TaxID=2764720 RepID=UPI0016513832|nr:MFS transporter [Olivibacter sp. SDN3]QNL51557.1 MFS transporter [Olivibacter sp. SDN3]
MNKRIYAWLVVVLLCVVGCLNYLDRTMITTMRASIIQAIPMTDGQFGLLTSVFLWTYGALSPIAGYLADRFNRSRVIIASLFIWSAVTWLTAYANSFEHLLITRILMGFSEACYIPAALALIMDYHRGETRSFANSMHMAGVMVGQSLGFVGGWLAERHTWNFAFFIFGFIGMGYALLLLFTLKDERKEEDVVAHVLPVPLVPSNDVRFTKAIRVLFSNKQYLLALAAWCLLGIVGWLIVGWLPTYFKEHFALSQTKAGIYATGYFHTAALIGVLVGGLLADRWAKVHPRGRILLPTVGLLVAAPAIYLASTTNILAVAIFCFMLFAFTRIFTDGNMMPILCLITDRRYRATGYGVLNLFSCLIGGLGIYIGGIMRDAAINLSVLFQIATLIILSCAFLLYRIRPSSRYEESTKIK